VTAQQTNAVRGVAYQDIEMLAWRAMDDVHDRAQPQSVHVTRPALGVAALIVEVSPHLLAEIAAELRWEEPEQPPEQPIVQR
jgi:hypothetical protein